MAKGPVAGVYLASLRNSFKAWLLKGMNEVEVGEEI